MLSVSIAMATYNGQQHILHQLDSLAAQNYIPAELVVTDDGSTDDTLSIVAKFAQSASFPVRVHRNEKRLGFRGNFMRAASLCRSELIAFCDQDDVWYDRKLEACVAPFRDSEVLLVYHNADVVTDSGQKIDSLKDFAAPAPIIMPMSFNPMLPVPGFTQVFRSWMTQLSDLWPISQDHRSDGESMAHDQWFYFLASIFGKIGYLEEPLAAYVQHGKNTCGHISAATHLHKMRVSFRNPADQLFRTAAAADIRAAILDAAKTRVDGIRLERAEIAAKNYRRLSKLSATRREIYVSHKFTDRFAAFLEILANGGYGGKWNLSGKSLVKDMFMGVPIGPR